MKYWKEFLFFSVVTILLWCCVLDFVPSRIQCNCSEDSFWTYPQRAQEFAEGFENG